MPAEKLNHPAIQAALRKASASKARRKLFDGKGMYLLIQPPTPPERPKVAGYWRLKYRVAGREKLISLGQYPDVSLESARRKCNAARDLLEAGKDPSEQRKSDRAAKRKAAQNTFEAVANEWLDKMEKRWAATNTDKVRGRFVNHLLPKLREEPVSSIATSLLVDVLKRIETESTGDTARRCRQYMNAVFRYAINTARIQANPTPHSDILNPIVKGRFATITDPAKVGHLLRVIGGYDGSVVVKMALKLAPLLFVRPGELRAARWAEVNLDAAEWTIPAERMKMRRPHLVPLSKQAVAILLELQRHTGHSDFLFPGERSHRRPISGNTINAALRTLGFAKAEMTGHGFRHMASTLLHESRVFASEVIERQLAHADGNKVRGIYNVAEYLTERVKMMAWWADRLDALAQSKNVVTMRKRG